MIVSTHNLTAMFTADQLKVTGTKKQKSMEKLSSGYRINRAADDAAGLSISETMRKKIRGLKQGEQNTADGVSWVQIGDGALEEVDDMLHRMNELCIKSLNGTMSKSDRSALQQEFDQIRTEIDRVSITTKFNEQDIFQQMSRYVEQGNKKWDEEKIHNVVVPKNTLIVNYTMNPNEEPRSATITVPEGMYTTRELIDIMNEELFEDEVAGGGMYLKHQKGGTVDLYLDGGNDIDKIGGGLSYLFDDVFYGGNNGMLLGTTVFENDSAKLGIVAGRNDEMSFDVIDSYTRATQTVNIRFIPGNYTRQQLIDELNNQLIDAGTGVRASTYGQSIKVGSEDAIITRFKGNMFKIDSDGRKYTSVFYDNTYYGDVSMTAGVYKGANIFPEDPRDAEHRQVVIDSHNNTLVFEDTNGNGKTTTVTIPDGSYSLDEIKNKLNELFADPDGDSSTDDSLDLKVSIVNGPRYKGLKITSQIKGVGSDVGLVEDGRSTALSTLFKDRVINNYSINYSRYTSNVSSSSTAVIQGGKVFTSSGDNVTLPFELTSSNNKFKLSLMDEDDSTVTTEVTVAEGTYDSASDLAAAVDAAIKNAINSSTTIKSRFGDDIADKINVTVPNNRLRIAADASSPVIRIGLNSVSGNTGYSDLFTGPSTVTTTQLGVGSTVTTNTPYTSSTTIDSTNNKLVLWIGTRNSTNSSYWTGTYANRYEITLPTGNVADNKQAILDAINNSVDKNIWLSGSNRQDGSSTYKGVSRDTGKTTIHEGSTEHHEKAATMSLNMPELSTGITIDGNNNKISLSVKSTNTGTVNKNLTIPSGTYTKDQFINTLQSVLDGAFGIGYGGLDVSYTNNTLVFTVRIDANEQYSGQDSDVNVGNTSYTYNSFMHSNAAGYQTLGKMENNIAIEEDKNKFTLTYTDALHPSSYQTASIYLDPGSYTRDELIAHMNTKFADAGVPITASSSSGMLRLTTNRGGLSNRVNCNYDKSANSAMPAIFGEKKGVVAQFDSSNKLVISTDQTYLNYLRITSESNMGSVFQKSLESSATVGPGSTDAPKRSYLQSATLPEQITIDQWNNDLKLTYNANSKSTAVSVTVADGTYTRQELADELTSKINDALHDKGETHDIIVEVKNDSLRITAGDRGSSYYFTDWNLYGAYRSYYTDTVDTGEGSASSFYYYNAGDFFDKVINRVTESTTVLSAKDTDGTTRVTSDPQSPAIVGRKDVVSEPVEIRKNVDDTLTLDITRGNESKTITIKIAPGQYDADSLKNELQSKIDEALAEGDIEIGGNVIEPGTIKVGVGGISTGVVGAIDDKSLNFRIDTTKLHQEGTWTVDGIGGNAAFSIFYQTDEEPKPAYFKGGKDITQGVEIKDGQDKLVFDLDDVTYELDIPHGKYNSDQLTQVLNDLLEEQAIPLTAECYKYEGVLRFTHNELGHHEISNVGGNAKSELFSNITDRKEEEKGPVWIQMSDEVGDGLNIDRPMMNATALKLSQASVASVRSAGHTLDMLSYALERVSDVRATFGAEQNRMEHTINNTQNAVENLTAAESRIRDADMATEMVRLSVSQILEQAGFSMLAQQNQSRQSVLNLLQ